MTIEYKNIPMVFAHVRFASDAREKMHVNRFTTQEVAAWSGKSTAALKDLLSAQHKNPEMETFLAFCNALNLNPLNYFDLAE